jgi:DNA-binding transcriptional MerR regulator
MIDENIGGNEQALQEDAVVGNDNNVTSNESSSESTVNPSAIRKSQTQGILNALSKASGTNLSSVEDAVQFIAQQKAVQTQVGGNVQPVEQRQPQQQTRSVSNNDLQEQFQKLQSELSQKEVALKGKELESDIMQSMGDRFDSDLTDYALQKVKSNIQWNEDKTYSIVNAKGQERYGQDGEPLTLKDLVEEVAQGNPKLLKQTSNTQSGSGLRPGQSKFAGSDLDAIPDYSRDPAAFKQWKQRNGLGKGIGLRGLTATASDSTPNRN